MATDRFLTLADVADILNISASQTYALVRNGDLEAIKIGGRGQWRVEREKLEGYIARMYEPDQAVRRRRTRSWTPTAIRLPQTLRRTARN